MRVGIPLLQSELNAHSGGWVAGFYYVRNSLNALASLSPEEAPEVVAFVPASFEESLLLPEWSERAPWLDVVRVPDELVTDLSQSDGLQALVDRHPVDVVFPLLVVPPTVFRARTVGWIPDFQHKRLDYFGIEERKRRDRLFAFLTSFCDRIACSSQAVRSDLEQFYPEASGKAALLRFVSFLPEAACAEPPRATLQKLDIARKYVYLPNQFWVHKNHRLAFEAWKRLKDAGRDVLLACTGWTDDYRFPGHYDQLRAYVADNGLGENVRLLGFVSRVDQIQLYRGAAAVLQPSLFEGWSTSIEDAKSLGKRLIVSDIPVHREQCGEDALYFGKDDAEGLAEAIANAWDGLPDGFDADAEAAARSAAIRRGQEFGRSLLALFREVSACGPPPTSADRDVMLPLLAWMSRFAAGQEAEKLGLRSALAASEADRAARLDVINRLNAALAASEADRAARLDVINRLNAALQAQLKVTSKLPVKVLRYLRIV